MLAAAPHFLARRLGRAQLQAIDAGLAVVVALVGWYAAGDTAAPGGWHEPVWVSAVTGIALGAPVAGRRRWPVAAAAAATVVAALSLVSGVTADFGSPPLTVAVGLTFYTLGALVDARRSAPVALACLVLIVVGFIDASRSLLGVSFAILVLCVCWGAGRILRERRAYAARTAELATAMAVDEERLRIAREVHDIVAHSMSLIAVKATIADHVADERPQEMREALRVIASTSRGALGDLRLALDALRTEPAYAPTPGMADLAGLANAAESTGVAVDLRIHGDAKVPDGVAQAVFRIVQEALTNVLKHAAATRCQVEVDVRCDEVRVEAVDNGSSSPSADASRSGRGLIGMRERVALFGGQFAAGPAQPHGWRVAATLRYDR